MSGKLIYQRSSIIKRSIQATLNLLGYEIRPTPKREADSRIPIELSEQDRELVHHVMANQLTMVSYERLSSTDHDFQFSDGKLAAPQYHASLKKEHNEQTKTKRPGRNAALQAGGCRGDLAEDLQAARDAVSPYSKEHRLHGE